MQGHAYAGPDDRTVDADELQVAAEKQFQLAGGLGGVPPLDGAGDQARELVVELVGQGPGAGFDHALQAVVEATVFAEAAAGRRQRLGQPAAQLGLGVGSLDPQRFLGLLPQRGGPVPQPGAGQHVVLEALAALAQPRVGLEAVGKSGDPGLELTAALVVGIGGHGYQPLAQARVQAVEDPPVDRVGYPAGRLDLEPLAKLLVMVGEIAVGGGHGGVEQLGVLAFRDDGPQGPPGQRGHLDGIDGPGEFGGEHALDILIAQRLGHRRHQVRGVAGEAGGVGRVGQPDGQPGHEVGGADPFGEDLGVEEVLLHELAQGGGELVLALDDQRGVRYRQAQRTAEQRRDREPVGDATDHGRFGGGLHIAEQGPVDADRSHGDEQHGNRAQQGGGPTARGDQAPLPHGQRLGLVRRDRCGGHRRGRFHRAQSVRISMAAGGASGSSSRWSSSWVTSGPNRSAWCCWARSPQR